MTDPLLPDDATFLGQQEFVCRITPNRRGLLVRESDKEQLRRAFQAAAAIWGGARFPILPVDSDGVVAPRWVQLAEVLGVQNIADFTTSSTGESAWTDDAANSFNSQPARPLEDTRFWNPHPVAVDSTHMVHELMLPPDESLLSLAGAGGYGHEDEVPLMRSNGWNIFERAAPLQLATGQIAHRTALYATTSGDVDTELHGGIGSGLGVVWIVDEPDSFDDAVYFWNVRAARPRFGATPGVEVLTTLDVARTPEFRDELLAHLKQVRTTTPTMTIASLTVGDDLLRDLGRHLGASEHTDTRVTESFGRKAVEPTFAVNRDPLEYWMVTRKSGNSKRKVVNLRRPATEFSVDSPTRWASSYLYSGHVNLDITSPSIVGPRLPAVAQLYYRNAQWAGDSLRLLTDNVPTYNLSVSLPTPAEVLRTAVQASGVSFTRSDKGQQIVGALTRSADLSIYRRAITAGVITSLTAKARRDLVREIQALRAEGQLDPAKLDELQASSSMGSRPALHLAALRADAKKGGHDTTEVAPLLEELVRRGIVEIGLVTKCPLCSLTEFQPLSTITNGAVCTGCGSSASFVPGGANAPEIHYRLATLFHTLSLNGGLAPLSAMALLTAERSFVEPGVNLFKDGKSAGEIDILGWQGGSLFAGESKSSAAGFAMANIDRDVDLAASVGADTYLAVCGEPLDEPTCERLESATAKHRISLRLLDAPQLYIEA